MKKKKNNRTCIKFSEPDVYLLDDCWEHVFSFLINQSEDKNKLNFKSLSLVSKQFLSITNRLIFSMKIDHLHLCYLSRFFHRFSNLNSLDLSDLVISTAPMILMMQALLWLSVIDQH
ncbi:unnamed protein product [Lathyrus oleraceus]